MNKLPFDPALDALLRADFRGTDYELLACLGMGGMGVVYEVRHAPTGRLCALKTLHDGGADIVARFRQEIDILCTLQHPNVVKVFDAGVTPNGRLFFTMELLEGDTLRGVYELWGKLPLRWALLLVIEAGCGLMAAHDIDVLHRDVKPQNIYVTKSGKVKLIDFGVAKATGMTVEGKRRTATGMFLGTPSHAAREVQFGEPATVRSDVYALALVLWELLSGRAPTKREIFETGVPGLDEVNRGDVPRRLQRAIKRATSSEPAERHPSVAALLKDLRAVLARLPTDDGLPHRFSFDVPPPGVGQAGPVGALAAPVAHEAPGAPVHADGASPSRVVTTHREPGARAAPGSPGHAPGAAPREQPAAPAQAPAPVGAPDGPPTRVNPFAMTESAPSPGVAPRGAGEGGVRAPSPPTSSPAAARGTAHDAPPSPLADKATRHAPLVSGDTRQAPALADAREGARPVATPAPHRFGGEASVAPSSSGDTKRHPPPAHLLDAMRHEASAPRALDVASRDHAIGPLGSSEPTRRSAAAPRPPPTGEQREERARQAPPLSPFAAPNAGAVAADAPSAPAFDGVATKQSRVLIVGGSVSARAADVRAFGFAAPPAENALPPQVIAPSGPASIAPALSLPVASAHALSDPASGEPVSGEHASRRRGEDEAPASEAPTSEATASGADDWPLESDDDVASVQLNHDGVLDVAADSEEMSDPDAWARGTTMRRVRRPPTAHPGPGLAHGSGARALGLEPRPAERPEPAPDEGEGEGTPRARVTRDDDGVVHAVVYLSPSGGAAAPTPAADESTTPAAPPKPERPPGADATDATAVANLANALAPAQEGAPAEPSTTAEASNARAERSAPAADGRPPGPQRLSEAEWQGVLDLTDDDLQVAHFLDERLGPTLRARFGRCDDKARVSLLETAALLTAALGGTASNEAFDAVVSLLAGEPVPARGASDGGAGPRYFSEAEWQFVARYEGDERAALDWEARLGPHLGGYNEGARVTILEHALELGVARRAASARAPEGRPAGRDRRSGALDRSPRTLAVVVLASLLAGAGATLALARLRHRAPVAVTHPLGAAAPLSPSAPPATTAPSTAVERTSPDAPRP